MRNINMLWTTNLSTLYLQFFFDFPRYFREIFRLEHLCADCHLHKAAGGWTIAQSQIVSLSVPRIALCTCECDVSIPIECQREQTTISL